MRAVLLTVLFSVFSGAIAFRKTVSILIFRAIAISRKTGAGKSPFPAMQ